MKLAFMALFFASCGPLTVTRIQCKCTYGDRINKCECFEVDSGVQEIESGDDK